MGYTIRRPIFFCHQALLPPSAIHFGGAHDRYGWEPSTRRRSDFAVSRLACGSNRWDPRFARAYTTLRHGGNARLSDLIAYEIACNVSVTRATCISAVPRSVFGRWGVVFRPWGAAVARAHCRARGIGLRGIMLSRLGAALLGRFAGQRRCALRLRIDVATYKLIAFLSRRSNAVLPDQCSFTAVGFRPPSSLCCTGVLRPLHALGGGIGDACHRRRPWRFDS